MFLHGVLECRNDRHKSDCICAVCQVTRRKKERDEILAIIDNETAAMDSNTSEQHDMEVSLHIYILLSLLFCFLVKGLPKCALVLFLHVSVVILVF